jgi:hypothetical protein
LASTAAFRQPRPSRSTIDADARHLFSRGAVCFRERLVWRCVDRRREEPAARRRAIDEQFCPGPDQSVRSPCGKKSTKPLVPLHSNPGQRILEPVWRRVATESLADWARSSRYRFRHSSNFAIHTSKTIVNESNLIFLARRPMRRAVCCLSLVVFERSCRSTVSQGVSCPVASRANFHLTRVENVEAT